MKKLSLLLAVILMLTFLMAGCGQPATPSTSEAPESGESTAAPAEKQKLTMLLWGTSASQEKSRDLMFEMYPELAEKMDIEFIVAGASEVDVAQKYRMSLMSNEYVADIIMLNSIEVDEFATLGTLVDCGDIMEANKDGLLPSAIDAVTYDGKVVGVTQALKTAMWYYNKTMFDEAGIDPTKITNTDEFIEAGLKFQAKFPDAQFFNWGTKQYSQLTTTPMAVNGARFCDDDGNYNIDQEPKVTEVLNNWKKIFDAGICAPIAEWTPEWQACYKDRTVGSTLTQSYFSTFGADLVTGDDEWGVALWPSFCSEPQSGMSQAGAQVLLVPTSAKNPELAKEYISFWASADGNKALLENFGSAPVREDVFEEFVGEEHPTWGSDYYSVALEAGKTAGRPPFLTTQSVKEFQIIGSYFDQFFRNEIGLEDMLKQCNQDLTSQIGNAYQ